jgi:hypothetical protein
MEQANSLRREVARDARRYLASEMPWAEFISRYGETDQDEEISELVDLIEHEPQRGGAMGVSEDRWFAYRQKVESVLRMLEASPE